MKKFIQIWSILIALILAIGFLYQILEPKELEPNEKLNQLLKGRNC